MQNTPHIKKDITKAELKNSTINAIVGVSVFLFFLYIFSLVAPYVFSAGVSTSSKTVSDIQTDIRRQFNEYTSVFLDDTSDLLDWINYATYDIVSKTHCMEDSVSIIFTSGGTEYSWPSGASKYITIKSIIYDNPDSSKLTSLLHADLQMLGNISNSGEPKYWYDWNDNIGIYPTPDAARSGHTAYTYFVPRPDEYTDTASDIMTPAIYDNAIVNYCIYKALMKDRRYQEAERYLAEYNNTLQQYRIDLVDKQKEPREITNP